MHESLLIATVTGRYVGQGSGSDSGDYLHWIGLGLLVVLMVGLMVRGYLVQCRDTKNNRKDTNND